MKASIQKWIINSWKFIENKNIHNQFFNWCGVSGWFWDYWLGFALLF